jgi:phospholipase/lecithinase/hemolysin
MKLLLVLFSLALVQLGHAANYPDLVVFGDSLSDMGNRGLNPSKPDQKFRDTWTKQLAAPARLNLPDFKPSGLSSYYGGGNYAVGGASTEYAAKIGSDRNKGHNLTQQVSKRYLNAAFNTNGVNTNALHIVVIGANDLMLASISLPQIIAGWAELDQAGIAIAKSTESQLAALAKAGVKHILWGNLFDVGQTPSFKNRAQLIGEAQADLAMAAITKATLAHNRELDAAIARLQKSHPSLQIIKLDLYSKLDDMIKNPAKYGFTDVTQGANDDQHLFSSDGLHPTTQGHKLLAEYAFTVLTGKTAATTTQPATK